MKKHIILAGAPRAGKSTALERIAKKLGYQHISMDSILAGLEQVFAETGIDTEAEVDTTVNLQRISAKIAYCFAAAAAKQLCISSRHEIKDFDSHLSARLFRQAEKNKGEHPQMFSLVLSGFTFWDRVF